MRPYTRSHATPTKYAKDNEDVTLLETPFVHLATRNRGLSLSDNQDTTGTVPQTIIETPISDRVWQIRRWVESGQGPTCSGVQTSN